MEWAAVMRDIVVGLLIAGAVGAWVPDSFWRHLFLTGHPLAAKLWGPIIGPVISLLSFVCSIGNVPLAGVLWNGGISFGGVVAFIFADLIIIPILIIYRKYYGTRMMLVLLGIFYATMVIAGYIVEFLFGGLGLIPAERAAKVAEQGIQWNYTTILNIVFLLLAAALLVRFFRSGGGPMLKMMGGGPDERAHARHPGPVGQPSLAAYGTTVTGHFPARTSRVASEPTIRCPACSDAPTTTASAFVSAAARVSSVNGSPVTARNSRSSPISAARPGTAASIVRGLRGRLAHRGRRAGRGADVRRQPRSRRRRAGGSAACAPARRRRRRPATTSASRPRRRE